MVFKKIDVDSVSSITGALSFFDIPPTNVTFSSASYREYLPLNSIEARPIHFKIFSTQSYLDLSKSYLMTEMRIKKLNDQGAWVNLERNEEVGSIQMIGNTFIKNLKISMGGKDVFDSNNLFHYHNYLTTELNFPNQVKESYLQSCGYYTDGLNQDALTNPGYLKRKSLFRGSRSSQFISRIDADLFNQQSFMVNNIEMDLEIIPNDDAVCILAPVVGINNNTYRLEILDCRLFVKQLQLMPGLDLDINRKLETSPARYAIRKTMLKSLFISQGHTYFHANIWMDLIPRRIIIGFLKNKAFVGAKNKSPFNFKPFDVREISVNALGVNHPATPYNLDFENGKTLRPFHDLHNSLGFANSFESNGINLEMFNSGWTFFVFNLTNSLEDEQAFDLLKSGTTTVHIGFSTPIPNGGVTMIALGELDSLFMIDKNRNLTSDVSV